MAKEYGAELTLLHVLDDVREAMNDLQNATENATKQLEESLTQEDREACNVKLMVRVGKPYAQIIQLALEAQTDMVIMGVRGSGALDTAIFGSTTHRVIQLGPCPVLAIHI
jgi:nucleotide-binding universal stress UspA family protein